MTGTADDRLPVVLVVLDGLGDRPIAELDDRTPSEAASTPVMDALADRGASGWHIPFGWGRAPSSEVAHWTMFGYGDVEFPGRAVLEGLGAAVEVPFDVPTFYAALRTSQVRNDEVWITGRASGEEDVAALTAELQSLCEAHDASYVPLPPVHRGEALLSFPRLRSAAVTDSDPFFEEFHPWLRPQPTAPEGADAAANLTDFLLECRRILLASPINALRPEPLDVLTTKWAGVRRPVPGFVDHVGVNGAAVTSTRLYRGLAAILGMRDAPVATTPDLAKDVALRVEEASRLIDDGVRFVHVHSKATDEAGHTKTPHAKRDVLEEIDAGLAGILPLADRAIVAVTGDHATPSTGSVLHTGDPTPLVVAGPTVRREHAVTKFGESWARAGDYGILGAADLLPLLFGHANRPTFMGHRPTRLRTIALPDHPPAMPSQTPHG